MHRESLLRLLSSVQSGKTSVDEALAHLKDLPYENLSFARVDHHRHLIQGVPEVILAKGKTIPEIKAIAGSLFRKSGRLLITKASREIFDAIDLPGALFHPASGLISAGRLTGQKRRTKPVLVVSAGTSDIPVAEEAAVTSSFLGSPAETVYDVGVAGIHRLLDRKDLFRKARVIIVVAGMEGALPSVVGGLTDRPVIAVPTSTGYGTSFAGLTALFAMLNSCVPGIAVMNIDNGFGAGCLAHRIVAS